MLGDHRFDLGRIHEEATESHRVTSTREVLERPVVLGRCQVTGPEPAVVEVGGGQLVVDLVTAFGEIPHHQARSAKLELTVDDPIGRVR